MKRASAVVLVLVALAAIPLFAKRRAVGPRGNTSTAYLEAARQAANWLATMERRTADGISWASSDKNAYNGPGLSHGASGIGLFHLRLYQVTREPKDLDIARGAASFVAAEYRRGREGGYDWQTGAVGGGEFFVLMYRETRDPKYLEDARMTGEILLRQAKRDASGTHWEFPGNANVYTGIAHGAAGAGVFFVHLYDITGDPRYLDVARDTYKWLRQHHIAIGADGIGWKRLTKDAAAYHGFCGGSSGIIHFLDELARATGEESYRNDFIATANGLANDADRIGSDRAGWRYYTTEGSRGVIYCHGTSCATAALVQAWMVTGNDRYRGLVRAGARHLDALALALDGAGPLWPHIERSQSVETGFQTGAASVGYTYLRVHAALGDRQYLDQAVATADNMIRIADRPAAGQMRWINYKRIAPGSTSTVAYDTGWYTGSAGIGLFLLDLHERLSGRPPLERFSPMRP